MLASLISVAHFRRWVTLGPPVGVAVSSMAPLFEKHCTQCHQTQGTPLPGLADAVRYTTPSLVPEAQGGELAVHDEYRCFMLDSNIKQSGFVNGYEVLPGAPEIVHHVLAMLVDPAAMAEGETGRTNLEQMMMLDAESPERVGWPCYGGAGEAVNALAVPVVWAPGQGVVEYPHQSGVPIAPDHKVVIQIHYNLAEVHGHEDHTTVKLRIVPKVEKVGFFAMPDPFLDSLGAASPRDARARQEERQVHLETDHV